MALGLRQDGCVGFKASGGVVVNTQPLEEDFEESPGRSRNKLMVDSQKVSAGFFELKKNLSLLDRNWGSGWQGLNRTDNWEAQIKKQLKLSKLLDASFSPLR